MYGDQMHEATAFFDHLVRSETRLYNVVNDRLSAAHGIGTGPFEFLRYLRDRPDSRVSDLAGAFALGIGTTSKAVDRYEKNEWVARHPNPNNRRSSILALTDAGRQLVDDAEVTFVAAVSARLSAVLSEAEMKAALDALAKLRQSLEAANLGVPAG